MTREKPTTTSLQQTLKEIFRARQQALREALDSPPEKYTWVRNGLADAEEDGFVDARFVADGNGINVAFERRRNSHGNNNDAWEVTFYTLKDASYTLQNYGISTALKIFSTVLAIIQKFVNELEPNVLMFTASKLNDEMGGRNNSRAKLYDRMVKRYKLDGYILKRENEKEEVLYKYIKKAI